METKSASNFWWMKSANKATDNEEGVPSVTVVPRLELDISSSLAEFLEKEQNALSSNRDNLDVGSIIEEINRVAAQSPLGPFNANTPERSIDDIMKEAEKVYMESSKSFEQLSQRSKTSQNITDFITSSNDSTPTPKSLSPLPLDMSKHSDSESESELYSEDFSEASKVESTPPPDNEKVSQNKEIMENEEIVVKPTLGNDNFKNTPLKPPEKQNDAFIFNNNIFDVNSYKNQTDKTYEKDDAQLLEYKEVIEIKDDIIKNLEEDNKHLMTEIRQIRSDLDDAKLLLENNKKALDAKSISSPIVNLELERALEHLKDSQEINTSLQLQITTLNKTHQHLKTSYDDVLYSNKNLERRVIEMDTTLNKYKAELLNVQKIKDRLLESETHLSKLLDVEKLSNKSMKLQNDKDARCIQDLNRQIKEMERIIARKHPDSVSALIVAAKKDETDSTLTARKILEDRIKTLEQEATTRDNQSSKVFVEIQDKFNLMKGKYESHIEDLELHVSDLKSQLKRKVDTYDVYTQTAVEEQKIPQKESHSVSVQTETVVAKAPKVAPVKRQESKSEAHLIATIRGLQADVTNKEKIAMKLQKDVDELRKTNRRLQKEREGSLKSLNDKKEFRSYPDKLALQSKASSDISLDDDARLLKNERDKLQKQLRRLEEDYQILKDKRIFDLTTLQEAHECEIANYVSTITPLREQLEVVQVSLANLQTQLCAAKEDLAVVTVERDHLNSRLLSSTTANNPSCVDVDDLHKKIAFLETRYEEREHRLRAIVYGLAQKTVTNRSCEQCSDRQMQLIGYKNELDQLLASVRALQ
ncbi:unnamed protein product [Brassicogethes aeneus]|uniref:Centrosomal protein of 162 kDa n=1 Tax=Brassicogethes aeneus TaxID=1431903 RepID=A0A9P0FQF6_BRAAE|nr:unnamed protein product [Brassicogethes aeneus]